ncbi:MAG: DUF3347 domain-containing protein [Sphingobacteriales bacterium]|nr:DUF3347 domain-containing protein [Sphingobacteriales bacterium]
MMNIRKQLSGFALIATLSFFACSNNTNKTADAQSNNKQTELNSTSPKFENAKLNEIYTQYISLKTALVNDHAEEANTSAKMLYNAIENSQLNDVLPIAKQMVEAPDLTVKRAHLDELSNILATHFKNEKITSGVIYKQFCPMANDGKGGFWLANEAEIQNPYYGQKMSTCGSVEEEIK